MHCIRSIVALGLIGCLTVHAGSGGGQGGSSPNCTGAATGYQRCITSPPITAHVASAANLSSIGPQGFRCRVTVDLVNQAASSDPAPMVLFTPNYAKMGFSVGVGQHDSSYVTSSASAWSNVSCQTGNSPPCPGGGATCSTSPCSGGGNGGATLGGGTACLANQNSSSNGRVTVPLATNVLPAASFPPITNSPTSGTLQTAHSQIGVLLAGPPPSFGSVAQVAYEIACIANNQGLTSACAAVVDASDWSGNLPQITAPMGNPNLNASQKFQCGPWSPGKPNIPSGQVTFTPAPRNAFDYMIDRLMYQFMVPSSTNTFSTAQGSITASSNGVSPGTAESTNLYNLGNVLTATLPLWGTVNGPMDCNLQDAICTMEGEFSLTVTVAINGINGALSAGVNTTCTIPESQSGTVNVYTPIAAGHPF